MQKMTIRAIKGLICFGWIAWAAFLSGQNTTHYRGKVTDTQGKPIALASIQANRVTVATLTNTEGVFYLKLPVGQTDDTLSVSANGYEHVEITLKQFGSESKTIVLKTAPLQPAPIELDAEKIISGAIEKLKDNLSPDPVLLGGFYRQMQEVKIANKTERNFTEAVIAVYSTGQDDKNTNNNMPDQIHFIKGRNIGFKESAENWAEGQAFFKSLPDLQGTPYNLLAKDPVKYSYDNAYDFWQKQDFKKYDYTLLGIAKQGNLDAYLITFVPKPSLKEPLYSGKIWIDKLSGAIIEVDYFLGEAQKAYQRNFTFLGVSVRPLAKSGKVKYTEVNGNWVLQFAQEQQSVGVEAKGKTKKAPIEKYVLTFQHAFFATSTKTTNVEPFAKNQDVGKNGLPVTPQKDLAAEFWDDFNFIPAERILSSGQ